MRRCVFRMLGLALSVLCGAASIASAQDIPSAPNAFRDLTRPQPVAAPAEPLLLNDAAVDVKVSPNTGMARLGVPQDNTVYLITDLALQSSEYIDPRYVANSQHPDMPGIWERTREHYGDQIHRAIQDAKNFYLSENVLCVGIAIAIAAPLANTHADIGIRNWYQDKVGNGQSRGLDRTADAFRQFGEFKYAIPAYLAMSFGGNAFAEYPALGTVGVFGDRSIRALAVGAPMVGILQLGLGADRPLTGDSHWQPFRSTHSASGHAFVGAVPFLTAASMTDSYALKALLFTGSLGPAWSRIHNDQHYFSQVFLGWSMAYLSVQSVNQTECRFRVVPCDIPNGVGMGVQVQY